MPKVSICLPNLNNRAFLPERLQTIFQQSLQDWELVVVDNYSDDGAWEYLRNQSLVDRRISVWQAPREGMYANWNNCLRLAKGEYVYIATSDDTMPPECLERLVTALEAHPDCDIAHCPLKVIDSTGATLDFGWEGRSIFARSSGSLLNKPHVRRAPFDGLLHLGADSVYISTTQLLVRRSIFDRVGYFENKWGSMGDFNWAMRASLIANTVHVPTTWGGWRVHPGQATNLAAGDLISERRKIEEMIDHALETSRTALPDKVYRLLKKSKRQYFWRRWEFDYQLREQRNRMLRMRFFLKRLAGGSVIVWSYLGRRLLGLRGWPIPPIEVVPKWLQACGYATIEEA